MLLARAGRMDVCNGKVPQSQADALPDYHFARFGNDTIVDPTNRKDCEGQSPPDVKG